MIALTNKNYENLPEVKKKRDEQKRQEERTKDLKERRDKIKEMDAVRLKVIFLYSIFVIEEKKQKYKERHYG